MDTCDYTIFSSIFGLPSKGRYRIRHEIVFAGDKFVRHGAVGARLIHASAHARLRRWGAFKLLPYAVTCPNPGRWRFLSLRGAGLCTYRTKPAKFRHYPNNLHSVGFCILPCIVPQVVTNLGPVPDLIAVRARREREHRPLRTTILTEEAA